MCGNAENWLNLLCELISKMLTVLFLICTFLCSFRKWLSCNLFICHDKILIFMFSSCLLLYLISISNLLITYMSHLLGSAGIVCYAYFVFAFLIQKIIWLKLGTGQLHCPHSSCPFGPGDQIQDKLHVKWGYWTLQTNRQKTKQGLTL